MRRPVVIRGGVIGGVPRDVLVDADGIVSEVDAAISSLPSGVLELDATGCHVAPGLVDLHAHLRQPGFEEAETVETASRAAVLGGYTAILAMPNTHPAVDSAGVVREVRAYAENALCHIEVAGSITVGREGKQLAPMAEMAGLGVHIFTDDDHGVADDRLMRRAMEYASGLGVTLAVHADVPSLSDGGVMHEGEWSSRLGLPGIPSEAEELMVMRDLALARRTGVRLHFQHLSTGASIAMVAAAKREGLPVTAEVAPQHFTLTDADCASFDARFKVRPPLRGASDRDAVRSATIDGEVDAIASCHSPHPPHEKDQAFDQAPPGMLGLETALAVAHTELDVPFDKLVRLMSLAPAEISQIAQHGRPIAVGEPANLMVFDPSEMWTVDPTASASLSRNTPFTGRELTGRVRHTIVAGEAVVMDGKATR